MSKIIGFRECAECGNQFGYSAHTHRRELCPKCTYAKHLNDIRKAKGIPEDYSHLSDGWPNYMIAYLTEPRDRVETKRIIGNYEIGVKSGCVGTHKQFHNGSL